MVLFPHVYQRVSDSLGLVTTGHYPIGYEVLFLYAFLEPANFVCGALVEPLYFLGTMGVALDVIRYDSSATFEI